MSLLLMISPSPVCQCSSECPPFICCKARVNMERGSTARNSFWAPQKLPAPTALPSRGWKTCIPYCSLNTFCFKASPPRPPGDVQAHRQRVFSAEPQPVVEKQSQVTAAIGQSQGLSHRTFCAAALQFGGSCGQAMPVGTGVGKLGVNSLTRHTAMAQWGICSRHAQPAWHWWTPSVYLSSNSSLDKEHYRWWIAEESPSRERAVRLNWGVGCPTSPSSLWDRFSQAKKIFHSIHMAKLSSQWYASISTSNKKKSFLE